MRKGICQSIITLRPVKKQYMMERLSQSKAATEIRVSKEAMTKTTSLMCII